ncbi:Nramp family divalent metal transporter [Aliikangiella sp. IMCC44653]
MPNNYKLGPAILVTAAFIGPGTVVAASLAGAHFGYALIWALLFSIVATLILQEMAVRLGVITQQGLGENLNQLITQPFLKLAMQCLIIGAIVIGNAAYQGGNLSGASLGIQSLLPTPFESEALALNFWPLLIGGIAFLLLWHGQYAIIEKSLILLVGLMSAAFLTTLIISKPDFSLIYEQIFSLALPSGATLTVIALIGTTVVPYNLFLHASSVSKKWHSEKDLNAAKRDVYLSIPLGGLITIAIMGTAAAAFFGKQIEITSAADLAPALQPLLGSWAQTFMGVGLFAAGISSAITAPLAAAFALSGVLNFSNNLANFKFKITWALILVFGVIIASTGFKPISIIWFAQVANGILLPIITLFLLWAVNHPNLRQYANSPLQNLLGGTIFVVTLILSGRSLMLAFNLL